MSLVAKLSQFTRVNKKILLYWYNKLETNLPMSINLKKLILDERITQYIIIKMNDNIV